MVGWEPGSYAQQDALCSGAEILLFGGAAGSLKSETLLVDALREHTRRRLRAVLFRRSYPELEKGLIRRSRELYPSWGARYNEQKRRWLFPSGATIEFAYCESERDIHRYQGAEFSFIGFDESTHFAEFPIRYMLSRLRSTDPGMALRMRLASNPGNIGHVWHKAVFHGEQCWHCRHPTDAKTSNDWPMNRDAVWPSDQRPIGKTTSFIPGRVSDHDYFGADYARTLETLPGAFRKALLEGCWDVYEGQYFDCWNESRMVVRRASIAEQPWWPHWVGIDYGFTVSQAAAYLFAKSPPTEDHSGGVTYVLEEYTASHQTAAEFGAALRQRWLDPSGGRRIQGWYLSPDAWANRGDGHTLADQMAQAAGFGFAPASTDRVGGAMLAYSLLDRGELVIADGCRELCRALPTRIRDPLRPDDIQKITGDPLDDCMDALRYGLYSFAPPAQLPMEFRMQNAVTSSDLTIAAIQRLRAEERLTSREATYLTRRGRRWA